MKICIIPSDLDAAGCYRLLFPAVELRKRGHDVRMPPYDQKEDNGFTHVFFDIKTRPASPDAEIYVIQQQKQRDWAEEGIKDLRAQGKIIVSELDDTYLNLPTYNPAWLGTHPYLSHKHKRILNREERRKLTKMTGLKIPPNKLNRHWMEECIRQSDGLTVSTPALAESYAKHNDNIRIIRNYLNWEMWKDVTPQYEVERERIRIGWMGHIHWRRGDLEILKPVIRPFLLKHPEVDFVASGSEEVHDLLGVPEGQRVTYEHVRFREFRVPDITAVMDIGLVPMVINDLNQAKSHLKGMEYNACGIPFIASPTESYKEYWCDEGRNGFLAYRPQDWLDHLETLVNDDALRRDMGRNGRELSAANTIERNIDQWEDFYVELLGDDTDYLARESIAVGAIQKAEELAGLLRVVKEQQPKVVVEIGTAQGGTFNGLCKSAHPEATLVSIDLPGGDFGERGADRYGKRDPRRMATFGLPGQDLHFLRGNSQLEETREALEKILDGRDIDFLFIDGDHAYEGVKRDFELYSPLVDGYIGFHDIVVHKIMPEAKVWKFWRELKGQKTEFVGGKQDDRGWGSWGGIGLLKHEKAREKVA